jgi:hypothetical protein
MQAKVYILIAVSVFLTCCAEQRSVSPEMPPAPAAAETQITAKQAGGTQIVSPAVSERRLVKNVELDLRVSDTIATSESLNKLSAELGGHVTSMNADRREGVVSLILRVPEGRLEEALARIKKLVDRIDRESVRTDDVTDQFVDLSARLKTLEATEGELRALLSESRQRQQRAEDIMAIYRELTQIRSNIEQIRGQLNLMENLTSLATITVNLSPTGSPTQVVSSWQPSETIRNSFRSLAAVMTGLVDFGIALIIVVIPPVLTLSVMVWLLAKAVRLLRSR